jgi:predicted nuclease of predicted toxin-antitoxin system
MKFKIDENLPGELTADLRAADHDADTVSDEGLAGAGDPAVLSRVQSEGRTFLTIDKGIADVRAYPPDQYSGIVLFRPRTSGRQATLTFIRQHLPTLLRISWPATCW